LSGIGWLAADWPAPAGVVAGTTLRQGGVSIGVYGSLNLAAHVGDDPVRVDENRRRVREQLRLPGEPVWLDQVHGTSVVRADTIAGRPVADGLVTSRRNVVCAVLTADCLPVVLASAHGNEVAVAHAGWRGLSAGILESTIAAMAAAPADLMAWLGPAISGAAFEVGDEVRNAFLAADAAAAHCFHRNERGRWQADLDGLAVRRLERAGVNRIHGGGRCTFSEPEDFFSYRRDGQCGRQATFAYRR
jgi:polyphenol oxidase